MTAREKKRRAAMIVVAYYLEQQAAKNTDVPSGNTWTTAGKDVIMDNRARVQRKGRIIKSRA